MLNLFDNLRNLSELSVALRLFLSVLCGGAIGLEREYKRRPAGLRTHILICLGAAMTMLISQYLLTLGLYTDISRLGAQVVAGVGFIGAGTIILTKRNRIKGLTTAAGLWTAAIVGLACGAGYYECAVLTTLLILFAEVVLARIERIITRRAPEAHLYVEYLDAPSLNAVIDHLHRVNIQISDFEVIRTSSPNKQTSSVVFSLRFSKSALTPERTINDITQIEGVVAVEEL